MVKAIRPLIVFILLTSILLVSIYSIFSLNTDFGKIDASTVKIETDQGILTGLLYRPANHESQKLPAIIIAHGISESSQIASGFGLELSRGGFVVLCLDLPGHGGSDGYINQGQTDPSLGIDAAVNYLSNLSYVDSTQIGLVGHSLGAGAVRAANKQLANVQSIVLIGGGVGDVAPGTQYGSFNATYPKNILIIVGKYDVLFDSASLVNKDLLGLFNTTEPIQQGVLYGDYQIQTARKLIIPKTTHLFESLDPTAIHETTSWMQQSLKIKEASQSQLGLIYQFRELTQVLSLLALLGLVLLAYSPLSSFLKDKQKSSAEPIKKSRLKLNLWWVVLNLVLFFPLIAAGLAIGFPPLIFGSSIAWWLLILALISAAILKINTKPTSSFFNLIKQYLPTKPQIFTAIILFLILYALTSCIQYVGINLKIIAPIFQDFASVRRFLVFFAFLPFFYPYFIIQQIYLMPPSSLLKGKIEYLKIIFVSVSPFLLFLGLNFLPKLLFDFWLIPSFAGFLIEFLWLMVPIFIITSFSNVYFYRKTQTYTLGAVFNTLMLAWISATVFPF
jgi:pimeloyl-ACP methyl ester carboxylesterase